MSGLLKSLTQPSLNWLLVFIPLAIAAEFAHARHAAWASPALIFAVSAIAIIPVAGWMGRATEHLATRLGEGVGGLLNATMGNAAELIIAVMALTEASRDPAKAAFMHGIVKASVTGSIVGNILLVMGLALLAGGLRHREQRFNAVAARTGATVLTLATVSLLVPALFAHFVPPHGEAVRNLSMELAVLLLAVYALSMLFTLHTHKHLYVGQAAGPTQDGGHAHAASWTVGRALTVLLIATAFVALLAEFMIGSVEEASQAFGLGEVFVGVVVVAIVGNAAEHSTAVLMAWRNRMDLAMGICIGSSIQVAIFIAPVLVLLSAALGAPMDLVFSIPEVVAVALAVAVVEQIAGDGESHWLEGVMLLTVYAILGVLFFHLPSPGS